MACYNIGATASILRVDVRDDDDDLMQAVRERHSHA
jgi:hypothetical protein